MPGRKTNTLKLLDRDYHPDAPDHYTPTLGEHIIVVLAVGAVAAWFVFAMLLRWGWL